MVGAGSEARRRDNLAARSCSRRGSLILALRRARLSGGLDDCTLARVRLHGVRAGSECARTAASKLKCNEPSPPAARCRHSCRRRRRWLPLSLSSHFGAGTSRALARPEGGRRVASPRYARRGARCTALGVAAEMRGARGRARCVDVSRVMAVREVPSSVHVA